MDIQLTDYKGHTWHLAGHREGDEGVTLHKISGTTGKLSDHPVPTTQHFPTHTYDTATPEPITPTLTVSITHTTSLTTETTIRRFLDGLDFYKPAILTFHQPRQPELQLFVHLNSPIGLPEETAPTDTTTLEIHLTAQDGRYFGPEHTSTGITTIENTGQLPLWPTIHWKGLTARITEDKNGPIILPPALGTTGLIYHTNPDTGGLITDTHGYPNHNAWATLRGIAWTRPIMPGDATTIDCHKCHIHWRNQYLQPWAQTGGIVSNARTSNNSNGRTWATASGRPHAIRLFD